MAKCGCSTRFLMTTNIGWKPYSAERNTGILDYFHCCEESKLAIRDVVKKRKKEPHYEDLTFNCCRSCNQPLVRGALKHNVRYVFFFTKYKGIIEKFKNRYFIVGFYEIGYTAKTYRRNKEALAIRATTSGYKFVDISDAYPLPDVKNARQKGFKKYLDEKRVSKILKHFESKLDKTNEYIKEVSRLS